MGFRNIKWALRKLKVPAGNGLVLDVGSGGRPYPRSDVLLDRLSGAEHRCGEQMMMDGRPAILGDANKMPFKDKAFDFVIASHILEHMSNPEGFLKELMRVGKAGYIETPNAIFERLYPQAVHCLEVLSINNELRIFKKGQIVEDGFLGNQRIFEDDPFWAKFFKSAPDMFHVRYYWEGNIKYTILNPNVSCEWIEEINEKGMENIGIKKTYMNENQGWREIGQEILKYWYKFWRKKRLKNFELKNILACPECHGDLQFSEAIMRCKTCNSQFSNLNTPDFTSKK